MVGSSPLTRGKRSDEAMTRVQAGLIPAHAGKTDIKDFVDAAAGAHPRSRGENHAPLPTRLVEHGSSPLTRGKHGVELRVRLVVGLIPAHAGKTQRRNGACAPPWAHPRSRGENPSILLDT